MNDLRQRSSLSQSSPNPSPDTHNINVAKFHTKAFKSPRRYSKRCIILTFSVFGVFAVLAWILSFWLLDVSSCTFRDAQGDLRRGIGIRRISRAPGANIPGHFNNNCNLYGMSVCSVALSRFMARIRGEREETLSEEGWGAATQLDEFGKDGKIVARDISIKSPRRVVPTAEDLSEYSPHELHFTDVEPEVHLFTEPSHQLTQFHDHTEQTIFPDSWNPIFDYTTNLLPSSTLGPDYISTKHPVTHQKFTLYMNTYDRISLLSQHLRYYAQFHEKLIDRIIVSWGDVRTDVPQNIATLVANINDEVARVQQKRNSPNALKGAFITIIKEKTNSLNNRYNPHDDLIRTDAVFCVDDDIIVHESDLKFAFEMWKWFPDQHVGYSKFGRTHTKGYKTYAECRAGDLRGEPEDDRYYYGARCKENVKDSKGRTKTTWRYFTAPDHPYSMVLNSACFFHRKYLNLYHEDALSKRSHAIVDQTINCEDLTMSFLIAHISKKPPILVDTKYHIYHMEAKNKAGHHKGINLRNDHYAVRSQCMNDLVSIYGYMPLQFSNFKVSSVLMSDLNSRTSKWRSDGRLREEYFVSEEDD